MRGDARRLRDILSSIEDIQAFTAGMAAEDFLRLDASDRMKFRAVCNCVTTLGEACLVIHNNLQDKRITVNDIFSGASPFALTMLLVLIVVTMFPQVALILVY